jgi:hypothetical protein
MINSKNRDERKKIISQILSVLITGWENNSGKGGGLASSKSDFNMIMLVTYI